MMDETFDPYLNWLGIPPEEQPPDHYRLLGLPRFESDPRRIEQASDDRMVEIRRYQSGPRMAYTQRLLKEISVARLCLLDIQAKASYDTVLRGRQSLNSIGWEEASPLGPYPQSPGAPPYSQAGPAHFPSGSPQYAQPQPYAQPQLQPPQYAQPQPYGQPQPYAQPQPYGQPQPYAQPPQYASSPPHSPPSYAGQSYSDPAAYAAPQGYAGPHPYDTSHGFAAGQGLATPPGFGSTQPGFGSTPHYGAPPPVAGPPIASPPIAPPPIHEQPPEPPPIDSPRIPDHATGRPAAGTRSPGGRTGGTRGPSVKKGRDSADGATAPRGTGKSGRAGLKKRRSAASATAAHSDDDAAPGVDGETAEASASLFRSTWFLPTLALLGVGGILAMWIIVRSGAFRQNEPIAGLGDKDGRIEESVEDIDAASVQGSGGTGGEGGKKTDGGGASGRKTTHSTIDNPFGRVEIVQEGTGDLNFTPPTAEVTGTGLALETRGGDSVAVGWANAEQTLVWNFRLARPDIFRVELTYTAGEETRGAQFALQVDDEDPRANAVEPTGAPEKFRTDILHLTVRRSGKHQLRLAVQDLPMGGAIAVKSLRFIPKGLSDRKK